MHKVKQILYPKFHLNKKLHNFGLSNTQLCSFCKMEEETISHLFYYCTHIQDIWNQFTVNTVNIILLMVLS